MRAEVVEDVSMRSVEQKIAANVQIGSILHTDELQSYARLSNWYGHDVIRHAIGEYVRDGNIHTNTAESFWALFKRGYIGIYHWMSWKHLHRYADEFAYRFNTDKEEFALTFADVVKRVSGSDPLPYKALTA